MYFERETLGGPSKGYISRMEFEDGRCMELPHDCDRLRIFNLRVMLAVVIITIRN